MVSLHWSFMPSILPVVLGWGEAVKFPSSIFSSLVISHCLSFVSGAIWAAPLLTPGAVLLWWISLSGGGGGGGAWWRQWWHVLHSRRPHQKEEKGPQAAQTCQSEGNTRMSHFIGIFSFMWQVYLIFFLALYFLFLSFSTFPWWTLFLSGYVMFLLLYKLRNDKKRWKIWQFTHTPPKILIYMFLPWSRLQVGEDEGAKRTQRQKLLWRGRKRHPGSHTSASVSTESCHCCSLLRGRPLTSKLFD